MPYLVYSTNGTKLSPDLIAPVINRNGDKIYFSSRIKGDINIYSIDFITDNAWSKPTYVLNLNGQRQEVVSSIFDDNRMAIVRFDSDNVNSWNLVISRRDAKNAWKLQDTIHFNKKELGALWIDRFLLFDDNQVIFSKRTRPGNYLGLISPNDSLIVEKDLGLDFVFINWVSKDGQTFYATTNTEPRHLVRISTAVNQKNAGPVIDSGIEQEIATETKIKPTGKYYALLIGISEYKDSRLNLLKPVQDIETLKVTLTTHYTFDQKDVILLKNPTRNQIFEALYELRKQLTAKDNLLIFFAGHGYWDKDISQGYWWPSDSYANNPSNWLSNSDLKEQIRGIPSAHTLLISDACFSGGIFRTRNADQIKQASVDIQLLYRMKSRRAITSGTLSAVPDDSSFFKYLMLRLDQNDSKFLSSHSLFDAIRVAVINNTFTVPQDGVIGEAGDEGGDFIFIKRD
jgi:hypothetical protein